MRAQKRPRVCIWQAALLVVAGGEVSACGTDAIVESPTAWLVVRGRVADGVVFDTDQAVTVTLTQSPGCERLSGVGSGRLDREGRYLVVAGGPVSPGPVCAVVTSSRANSEVLRGTGSAALKTNAAPDTVTVDLLRQQ